MDRRRFLGCAASVPLAVAGSRLASPSSSTCTGVRVEEAGGDPAAGGRPGPVPSRDSAPAEARAEPATIALFLCGDVMTGRGLDQVLPHPGDPRLHEPHVRSATRYVELGEEKNGSIPAPVDYSYPWGDALADLDRVAPDARIINLETSVTTSDRHWRGKGIHYRMHRGTSRASPLPGSTAASWPTITSSIGGSPASGRRWKSWKRQASRRPGRGSMSKRLQRRRCWM